MISRSGREGRGEGEDSLAYHLSNETEDVSRACFPLPTSKDGDEREVWAPQKMQMRRIGEAMNLAFKLELEPNCTIVASVLELSQVLQTSLHTH